jgi:acid phosphatase
MPDHVVIVIEENHSFSEIIGSPSAPYINSLAAGGALMTSSYGITHPSQPNYLAFFSGSTQGVINDSVYPHSLFTAPNLGAKLLAAGLSFAGYSETMPSVGYDGASFGTAPATYQRKHNPWVNWQDSTTPLPANKLPPSVNLPFAGYFPSAANYASLPRLCFVIPNQLNDMHDGTVAQGDTWLQNNFSAYAAWCQDHNSLLLVTWDEDDASAGNRIATIFYGPMVVPGHYAETINHYNVLRTLEDMFALPHTAGTVAAAPILDIWVPCYANCDGSTAAPVLNVADFSCYLQRFAAGEPYANCDGSTAAPTLNVADFGCFLQRFAAGCQG